MDPRKKIGKIHFLKKLRNFLYKDTVNTYNFLSKITEIEKIVAL